MKSILILFFQFVTVTSWACLHFPKDYKGFIKEGLQEAFLFHDGSKAHLILRTHLSAEKFPKEISWVLPLPSVPAKYEEVDGPFFQELASLFPNASDVLGVIESNRKGWNWGGGKYAPAIKVHEKVDVGNYEIQPIEIMQDNSGEELNNWLKKHNYNSMPAEKQKRYLKKGAAFLAIRMTMNNPTEGQLVSKPLHITYAADRLTMPLLFTHDARIFDLNLFVFSQKELKKDLSDFYLERKDTVAYQDKHLKPFIDYLLRDRKGWITLYTAKKLNSEKKELKKLEQDPSFLLNEI